MSKKAQASSWPLKEVGEFLLRLLALLVLLIILAGILKIFTSSKVKTNADHDFERIVAELYDLEPGDSIVVPTLSHNRFIIKSMMVANRLGLNCRNDQGNWCACLATAEGEDDDPHYEGCEDEEDLIIVRCMSVNLPEVEVIFISDCGVRFSKNGARLTYESESDESGRISIFPN